MTLDLDAMEERADRFLVGESSAQMEQTFAADVLALVGEARWLRNTISYAEAQLADVVTVPLSDEDADRVREAYGCLEIAKRAALSRDPAEKEE